MSMGPGAGGPPWRFLRSDRSVVDNKIERRTVRRVLGFARPHRRLIAGFLAVTVVDAALVVVPPLLLKAIIDDGVTQWRPLPRRVACWPRRPRGGGRRGLRADHRVAVEPHR